MRSRLWQRWSSLTIQLSLLKFCLFFAFRPNSSDISHEYPLGDIVIIFDHSYNYITSIMLSMIRWQTAGEKSANEDTAVRVFFRFEPFNFHISAYKESTCQFAVSKLHVRKHVIDILPWLYGNHQLVSLQLASWNRKTDLVCKSDLCRHESERFVYVKKKLWQFTNICSACTLWNIGIDIE